MKFRHSKISVKYLIISVLCSCTALMILYNGQNNQPTSYYQQQLAAANLMQQCIDSLRIAPNQLPVKIAKKLDPNQTNLIGVEYSAITTTIGSLIAKRSSVNPDFAALIVRWFHQLNLKQGDIINVGCSGSFPALILSTLCAAEIMQLQPIVIASSGASSYGANRPDFTYLDMEKFLIDKGVLHNRTIAASLGGSGDIALGLSSEGRKLLLNAIIRNNVQLINEDNITRNVKLRAHIYEKKGKAKLFINIGGAQININGYAIAKRLKSGINTISLNYKNNPNSMIGYFANKNIPIIHLFNIEQLALKYDLALDPVPFPVAGKSLVYFNKKIFPYSWILSAIFILTSIIIIIWKRH